MKRVDTTHKVIDANGSGKDGFGPGTPGTTAGTEVDDTWLNHVQEEIAQAIEMAGITLSSSSKNQLGKAAVPLIGAYKVSGSAIASGSIFTISAIYQDSGFSVASNLITLPSLGYYQISFMGRVSSNLTSNPQLMDISIGNSNSAGEFYGLSTNRYSATAADNTLLAATYFFECVDVAKIVKVISNVSNLSIPATADKEGRLTIVRLRGL